VVPFKFLKQPLSNVMYMFFILKENIASGPDTAVAGDKILGTLQFIHRDFVCGSAKSPLK